jgi:hypothetical protein
MQHWYAYHSEKKMGRSYPRSEQPRFFITKRPASLQPGDWLWVIEGNAGTPTRFSLADCFEIAEIRDAPVSGTNSKLKFELRGVKSKLIFSFGLNRADEWFAKLHGMYLSRGIPFNRLDNYPEIIAGLKTACAMGR